MSTSRRRRSLQSPATEARQRSSTAASAVWQRRYGGNGLGTMRPAVLGLAKLLMLPIASAAPLGLHVWERIQEDKTAKSPDDPNLWVYLGVAVLLVLLGGAFAGLTIALMGQDETYLQVIATSGEGNEKVHAEKVLNLLKKGKHWVLVTLLLSNVITNETLPIVLDRSLGGGWPAVLSSTVLIVIFGEIAPQSVCVRYGLSIGAFMAPAVLALMWIMAPIAWPTAKLLDWLLGEDHGTTYKKAGLKTLVKLHKTLGTAPGERLMEDEVHIIESVLDLKDKPIGDIMTPMQDVFTLSADTVLDERMMDTILSQGYSRIPVYAPDNHRNFIGMLLVKILITYDPEDARRVREFSLATLPEASPRTSCLDIINFFQEGKSHMVLVSDSPGLDHGAIGVVTLEDVIEELIGEEIVDESDVFIDIHKAIRRSTFTPHRNYKYKHGKLIEVDEGLISESEREGKADGEDAPLLGRTDSRKSSLANGQANGQGLMPQGPGTTFLMRRKSSTASDSTRDTIKPVAVRSNTADMRQHLKHLGPSNAASNPRATKYTSVKIKPGVGTIPENRAVTPASERDRSTSAGAQPISGLDSETSALLKPSGKIASDGVAALQAGYGTNEPGGEAKQDGDKMPAAEASRLAEEHTKAPPAAVPISERGNGRDSLQVPEKMVVGADEDTVGEMEAPSRDRSKPRRTARSGSITETTVDAGGVKKIVLETQSSSSDELDASPPEASQSKASLLGDAEERADEEGDTNAGGEQNGQKRKKKKGKRRKGGGASD